MPCSRSHSCVGNGGIVFPFHSSFGMNPIVTTPNLNWFDLHGRAREWIRGGIVWIVGVSIFAVVGRGVMVWVFCLKIRRHVSTFRRRVPRLELGRVGFGSVLDAASGDSRWIVHGGVAKSCEEIRYFPRLPGSVNVRGSACVTSCCAGTAALSSWQRRHDNDHFHGSVTDSMDERDQLCIGTVNIPILRAIVAHIGFKHPIAHRDSNVCDAKDFVRVEKAVLNPSIGTPMLPKCLCRATHSNCFGFHTIGHWLGALHHASCVQLVVLDLILFK